jgi:PST family polysaccharide transporter/lipopolysaccharide exporter
VGVETFTQTGFGAELIHRQRQVKRASDVAWTLNIIRGITLTLICFSSAPLVARFYHKPILEVLIKAVSLCFFIKGFRNINVILLQKNLDFKKIAILQQTASLISLTVTLSLAYALRNAWALVWGTLSFFLCDLVLSYIIQPERPHFCLDRKLTREIFHYGIFITGSGIVVFLITELDNATIGIEDFTGSDGDCGPNCTNTNSYLVKRSLADHSALSYLP